MNLGFILLKLIKIVISYRGFDFTIRKNANK